MLADKIGGGRSRPRQVPQLLAAAILSMGESWHNLHQADPTCARHGSAARSDRHLARLI